MKAKEIPTTAIVRMDNIQVENRIVQNEGGQSMQARLVVDYDAAVPTNAENADVRISGQYNGEAFSASLTGNKAGFVIQAVFGTRMFNLSVDADGNIKAHVDGKAVDTGLSNIKQADGNAMENFLAMIGEGMADQLGFAKAMTEKQAAVA